MNAGTEDALRSEAFLLEAQSICHTGSLGWSVVSGDIYWSGETYNIWEYDRAVKPTLESVLQRIHPDDREVMRQTLDHATKEGTDLDIDNRLLMPDGRVKHIHLVARALKTSSGDLEFVGAVTDVTTAKQAERKTQQSERELRQVLDLTPLHITEFAPDGTRLYNNRAALEYHGMTLKEWQGAGLHRLLHPQDVERVRREQPGKLASGVPYELEARLRRKDGQYRWFLARFNPMLDELGHPIRWYAAATDIEDRKQAEQRIQDENLALREQINHTSMFEEIVGVSPALQVTLASISMVAPTESTVLILGETGTGKELIARAIYKHSRRADRAFVCVNCAAIAPGLIASELFGHEKGAFTGAMQQRRGRFELAHKGTIFLDEIGEMPAETQLALLRVLQERQFERVGGSNAIPVDVRVIAATNSDLAAAVAAGKFRSDLFYRLNVFPIDVPPLRQRSEDVPLLVEYFVKRFAERMGKRIRRIDNRTMELCQAYAWPGNIRELQNIVERSVILCAVETLAIDEAWFAGPGPAHNAHNTQERLPEALLGHEKTLIEAALTRSRGKVAGANGAAAKLGIPASTLESKIQLLKIEKRKFTGG